MHIPDETIDLVAWESSNRSGGCVHGLAKINHLYPYIAKLAVAGNGSTQEYASQGSHSEPNPHILRKPVFAYPVWDLFCNLPGVSDTPLQLAHSIKSEIRTSTMVHAFHGKLPPATGEY